MKRRGAASVLADLRQDGCLKARFPRPVDWAEVVTLNSSGGVAGGDRLDSSFAVFAGAQATFASQAAERFYRALPGDPPARIRTRLTVAEGGAAEWLPQEAIVFDRAALDRVLEVDLAEDAWFLGVESLVFGRTAMGEQVATAGPARHHSRSPRRAAAAARCHSIVSDVAATLSSAATANGSAAVATLVHVAVDAELRLDDLRAAWKGAPAETGASAWNGMLVGRVVAR